jgi:hypothetical protein
MSLIRSVTFTSLLLLAFASAASADHVLLTNLDMPVAASGSPTLFTGQSFQQGLADSFIPDVTIQVDSSYVLTSSTKLELESRNADGTVGSLLYGNFTASVVPPDSALPSGSERIIFKAATPFTLTAGTYYWLVVSDAVANGVPWQFTTSDAYQSQQAYGIPAFDSSWTSNADNGNGSQSTYYDPSSGNQIFQLSIHPVSEPSSLALATLGVGLGAVYFGLRRRGDASRAV